MKRSRLIIGNTFPLRKPERGLTQIASSDHDCTIGKLQASEFGELRLQARSRRESLQVLSGASRKLAACLVLNFLLCRA